MVCINIPKGTKGAVSKWRKFTERIARFKKFNNSAWVCNVFDDIVENEVRDQTTDVGADLNGLLDFDLDMVIMKVYCKMYIILLVRTV